MNHICMILHVSELYLPCHSLPFFLVSRDQADGSAQRRCCVMLCEGEVFPFDMDYGWCFPKIPQQYFELASS